MMHLYTLVRFFLLAGIFFVLCNGVVTAQTSSASQKEELNKKIQELEGKVAETHSQGNTLASQISSLDNQVKLTEYRMTATQQEITALATDIDSAAKRIQNLEGTLKQVSETLLNRIVETYQRGGTEPIQVLFASGDVTDMIQRANYLRIVQAHDKKLLYDIQQSKNDYANQKQILEGKKQKIESLKAQLEAYTKQLDEDKKKKQHLLEETKNDEKKFQQLLAQAKAEYAAIQSIVAGNGAETEVGPVTEGSRIASIISGASCNSSGGHLHFIVKRGGSTENPFSYLKPIDSTNCSGSSCGSSDGDPFNPSGSWEWPLNGPITFNQGYGATWGVKNSWMGNVYSFHNGIDIVGSSGDVKAVKSGTLYRGSYTVGCTLPYVRVRHEDGLDTLYLHVSY